MSRGIPVCPGPVDALGRVSQCLDEMRMRRDRPGQVLAAEEAPPTCFQLIVPGSVCSRPAISKLHQSPASCCGQCELVGVQAANRDALGSSYRDGSKYKGLATKAT